MKTEKKYEMDVYLAFFFLNEETVYTYLYFVMGLFDLLQKNPQLFMNECITFLFVAQSKVIASHIYKTH